MSLTVSYFGAWAEWFSGREVDPQATMGPISVLWWGRLGKIIAFLGGSTVVLDLVGTERIRYLVSRGGSRAYMVIYTLPRWQRLLLFPVAWAEILFYWFGLLLESPRWEPRVRWSAVALLLVGFHLDLLAS